MSSRSQMLPIPLLGASQSASGPRHFGADHARLPHPHADGALSMKKLVLETTAPFQGLPELVAYDEGLFAKEGLLVEWSDREAGGEKKVETHVTDPKGV